MPAVVTAGAAAALLAFALQFSELLAAVRPQFKQAICLSTWARFPAFSWGLTGGPTRACRQAILRKVSQRATGADRGRSVLPGDKVLLLPPLEKLEACKPSKLNGTFLIPCFPLPLQHAALPGTQRTLNIGEPRYVSMYDDMLQTGKSTFVVPHFQRDTDGVRIAATGVTFQLDDIKDPPASSRSRYICSHVVGNPVRIRRILNPSAFVDKSTYLVAECETIGHDDPSAFSSRADEQLLMNCLHEVADLQTRLPDQLRRWELTHDARGVPWLTDNHLVPTVCEDSLEDVTAGPDGIWHLSTLWQGYCERRIIALRQAHQREPRAAVRDGRSPQQATGLQNSYKNDLESLTRATGDLMQRLLQAPTHIERVSILSAAVQEEAQRLAAASALQSAIGGETLL